MEKLQLVDEYIYIFKNRSIICGSHSFNIIHFMGYRTYFQ